MDYEQAYDVNTSSDINILIKRLYWDLFWILFTVLEMSVEMSVSKIFAHRPL